MFAKPAAVLAAMCALPLLAVATPWGSPTTTHATVTTTVTVTATSTQPVSQCNTGSIQCCNQVESSNAPGVGIILGLLGIVLDGVEVLVGLDCSPVTVGAGGSSGW